MAEQNNTEAQLVRAIQDLMRLVKPSDFTKLTPTQQIVMERAATALRSAGCNDAN